jgi:hypothetical protein
MGWFLNVVLRSWGFSPVVVEILVLIFSGLEGATDDEENNSKKRPQIKERLFC